MGSRSYRFSLKRKMVIGICSVAAITYAVSGAFIFVVSDYVAGPLGISSNAFIIITLILGIAWTGILGYFGALVIVRPLERLRAGAAKVAEGDLQNKIEVPNSDDELRSLTLAYNEMIESLSGMVQDVNGNFVQTNEKVREMKESYDIAGQRSEDISHTVEEMSSGAQNSAKAIQEASESMEDVRVMASQVEKYAKKSDELSAGMVETLNESREVIDSLVGGVQHLAEENATSLEAAHRLESNTKKVEEIISLVGDIAEQTNLLALNASIEAARAGEHGRGFAVVAEEVRKLADESANAVQGISDLLKNIQNEVKGVVNQVTEQVKQADAEAKKGTKANDSITEISDSVSEVAASVREILQLVEKQMKYVEKTAQQSQTVAAVAEETASGTSEVSDTVEKQSAVMREIALSSEALLNQADSLKQTIMRFKV